MPTSHKPAPTGKRKRLLPGDDPDDPLLNFQQVADLLTELGRPTKSSTVRSYRRYAWAGFPVPDEQIGGHKPAKGEQVRAWPKMRDPQPGELIGALQVRWLRSTIVAWNATRSYGKKDGEEDAPT